MRLFLLITFFLTFLSSQELINVNLKNLSLIELIKITSRELNINILVTENIEGSVNFISNRAIKRDELLELLKLCLYDNGYKLEGRGSFYKVIKKEFSNSIRRNSVITKIVPILNRDALEIQNILLNINLNRREKNRISISLDKSNNSIVIDGSYDEVKNLLNIVQELDKPKIQVFVNANIIEVDDSLVEEIGIKYGILGAKVRSGNLYTFSSSLNNDSAITFDSSNLGLDIPNVNSTIALGASLNLLNRIYALNIISQPSILCLNNTQSSIYVGETLSIQTASTTTDGGTIKNSFKREDIGLSLKVKPRVSNENKVLLEIETTLEGVKNIATSGFNPSTSKKQVITKAIVNNGESVIIGGLMETKRERSIQKIPIAGDIPLIGELFKNRLKNNQNRNLVVIVTPYIIPLDKDLTYVRTELAKLKSLEDKFLEKLLFNLKSKKQEEKKITNEELHRRRVKEYFGI